VGEEPANDDLAGRLRAWPTGPDTHAAVELVIAGGWLDDDDFVAACVVPVEGDPGLAVVDWAALAHHAGSLRGTGSARGAAALRTAHAVAARGWGAERSPDGSARVRVTRRDDSAVVVVDGDRSLVIPGRYCR
jgi:hypothetical protein